jgi:uncharacterized protein
VSGWAAALAAPFAGGLMIGLAAVLLLALLGRIAGISGILAGLLPPGADWVWRLAFLVGLPLGAAVIAQLRPGAIGAPLASLPVLLLAGLAVGLGTGFSGGCTSGHGVCGMARLSPRSIVATLVFMLVAGLTVFLRRHLFA